MVSERTLEMRALGLVPVAEAARMIGIRPGALFGYMHSGVAPHFYYKGIPAIRRAMVPVIAGLIMEARDNRPFVLGLWDVPGNAEYIRWSKRQ